MAERFTPRTRDRLWAAGMLVLIAVAVWLVYGRAIDAPLIFDDQWTIAENPSIVRLWPLVGDATRLGPLNPPLDIPTCGRPLVNLSFALNYHFDELNPRYYRLVNMLLHVLSAALLGAIVRRTLQQSRFGGRFEAAAWPLGVLVALVWALHPLQTEAVVYVTQRTELLMACCYLATLYASIRYWPASTPGGRTIWLVLATLACLAGMASKEVMVSAPIVVLLYERAFVAGSLGAALRRSWPLYVGLALGWLLLVALNYQGPRAASAGFHHGVAAHSWWLAQTKVLLLYLKLTIWPWPLVIHYGAPPIDSFAAAFPALLLVFILAIGTFVLLWRNSPLGFLAACVWLILSPTLIVPILTEYVAERRMYLPLAALIALVLVGGYSCLSRWEQSRSSSSRRPADPRRPLSFVAVLGGIGLVVLSVVAVNRLSAYRDELTLWEDALQHQPGDVVVRNNLGVSLLDAGRLSEAIEHLNQALGIKPDHAESFYNLGNAMVNQGHLDKSVAYFEQALKLKPEMAIAHYNLGNVLIDLGRPTEAVEHLQMAIDIRPDFADAHNNLASALRAVGRVPEAIEQLQQAVRLKPPYTEAWANLASAAADADRGTVALPAAEEALRLAKLQGKTVLAAELEAWLNSYRALPSSGGAILVPPALPPTP